MSERHCLNINELSTSPLMLVKFLSQDFSFIELLSNKENSKIKHLPLIINCGNKINLMRIQEFQKSIFFFKFCFKILIVYKNIQYHLH